MNNQTKAQRLAEMIERYNAGVHSQAIVENYTKAAAELRRLDALVGELVGALEDAIDSMGRFTSDQDSTSRDIIFLDNAFAALAKAKEQT